MFVDILLATLYVESWNFFRLVIDRVKRVAPLKVVDLDDARSAVDRVVAAATEFAEQHGAEEVAAILVGTFDSVPCTAIITTASGFEELLKFVEEVSAARAALYIDEEGAA